MTPSRDIHRLLEIMAALRAPETGCPWDLVQTFATIAPYTIEEAYEVADAIERNEMEDLRDELGDLLLQVVFHARMAQEAKAFDFGGVVEAVTSKLIRRHPHVFGDAGRLKEAEVNQLWQRIKDEEKAARGSGTATPSALDGVPVALPALTRALKLQAKAAKVGFDWGAPEPIVDKISEELGEVVDAAQNAPETVAEEIGDLLFAVVNLARHYAVDPETALRGANAKFTRRFGSVEAALAARGTTPLQSTLDEMDELWNAAKRAERHGE
jgi:ATP diphosphatase